MELEIKINERLAKVELIEKIGNNTKIKVDDLIYNIDLVKVKNDNYSIIIDGRTYNIELNNSDNGKLFVADTDYDRFEIQVIDAQTKYLQNRNKGQLDDNSKVITAPMPGKIVRIPCEEGDFLKAGQTAIVVEAMKMQSEYEVKQDCHIKKILVTEGQIVNGNQTLIILD